MNTNFRDLVWNFPTCLRILNWRHVVQITITCLHQQIEQPSINLGNYLICVHTLRSHLHQTPFSHFVSLHPKRIQVENASWPPFFGEVGCGLQTQRDGLLGIVCHQFRCQLLVDDDSFDLGRYRPHVCERHRLSVHFLSVSNTTSDQDVEWHRRNHNR